MNEILSQWKIQILNIYVLIKKWEKGNTKNKIQY